MATCRKATSDSGMPKETHEEIHHSQRNIPVSSRWDREEIVFLNRRRAGFASRVTVNYSKLCKADDENKSVEEIEEVMGVLEVAFHRFKEVHIQYVDLIVPVDPDKLDRLDHYQEMENVVMQARDRCEAAYFRMTDGADVEITPHDSISQVGTCKHSKVSKASSNASSTLAKLAAKKTALAAKAQMVEEKYATEMKIKERMGHLMLELHQRKTEAIKRAQEAEWELEKRKQEAEESAMEAEIEKKRMELMAMADMQKLDMEIELEATRVEEETLAKLIEGEAIPSAIKVKPLSDYSAAVPHSVSVNAMKTPMREPPHISTLNPAAPEWKYMPQSYQQQKPIVDTTSRSEQVTKLKEGTKYTSTYLQSPKTLAEDVTSQQADTSVVSHETQDSQEVGLSVNERHIFAQRQLFDAIRLPKTKIAEFDGNPLRFAAFMNSFDSFVDKSTVTDADKLTCLMGYCVGKAAKVIEPSALMEPSDGYRKARELHKRRFGDPYTISQACVTKIVSGPPIKPNDGEALREFADDVRGCLETLGAVDRLNDVDSQERMVKVMSRLPIYLQSRWRKQAYKTKKDRARYPDFQECVEFLEMVAEEACDPVFGKIEIQARGKVDKGRKSVARGKGASFNVQASNSNTSKTDQVTSNKTEIPRSQTKINCHICSKGHSLTVCDQFKKMTPQKRVEAVKKRGLCYGCLDYSNHGYRKCRRANVCQVKDCALADQLQLRGHDTTLSLETLGEDKTVAAVELQLEITSTTGRHKTCKIVDLPRVFAMKSFPTLTRNVAMGDITKWSHLQDLKLPQDDLDSISILIGQDVPTALIALEVRCGRLDDPYAVRTILGWTVNGPVAKSADEPFISNFIHAGLKNRDDRLEDQVEQFWKLDSGPILAKYKTHPSQDDNRVVKKWNESISMKNGHYHLDIPFKESIPKLPNNQRLAERRLQSLGRRLAKDPGIQDLVDKGYAEKVPLDQVDNPEGSEWYLPHHNVVHPAKPDKFQIVFDCAAEYGGTSLNKEVLQRPDLTNNLIGVLLRFRERSVAIMGDIEGMFHQVKVSNKHRDALRFLLWKDGEMGSDPEVFRMTVHLFGGLWSPSCASFALRKTAADYIQDFPPEVIDTVNRDFYVDDCLRSLDSDDQAIEMIVSLCELLFKGGFRLTKWSSNSKRVFRSVPFEERAKEVKSLDLDSDALPVERALGIHWDTEADVFGIKIRQKTPVYTRRGLLRITSSVYDPLGFVSPYVLQAKKIFQDECKLGKVWDDNIDPVNCHKWEAWLKGLPKLERFKVPRCLIPDEFGKVMCAQLHHFGDASEDAYGAASYLRVENVEGRVHCALVMAKSRLAPIHQITVPRLELCAAVTTIRMDSLLRNELSMPLQESVFWTDSTTILHYIWSKTKRFQTFVANRLATIHEGSSPSQWRYVNSKDNPADDASRGLNAKTMLERRRWCEGPEFLWKSEGNWPSMPVYCPSMLDDNSEVKKETKSCAAVVKGENPVDRLLHFYSDWFRLRKAVAWYRRFGEWLKCGKPKLGTFLTVKELQTAERAIIRYSQEMHYASEIQSLKTGKIVSKKSCIFGLEPFYDCDGLLKIGGRLDKAPIAEAAKHPIIVPRDHHVTELMVRHIHEWESCHRGREFVMSVLRQRYWIPHARPLVKRIL
ncbi:uncharacterized protein LOC144450652 [Glandiceps talaboti]